MILINHFGAPVDVEAEFEKFVERATKGEPVTEEHLRAMFTGLTHDGLVLTMLAMTIAALAELRRERALRLLEQRSAG